MVSVELVRFCGYLLLWTSYVVFFADEVLRKRAQKTYEIAFLEKHRVAIDRQMDNVNEHLPLTFARRETETLFKLCKEYRSKYDVEYYLKLQFLKRDQRPVVQIRYIILQWINYEPKYVRVQVLRCTQEYALIEAGNDFSGFVLKKYDQPTNFRDPSLLFNIDTKFYYQPEMSTSADSGVGSSSRHNESEENRPQNSGDGTQVTTFLRRISHQNTDRLEKR